MNYSLSMVVAAYNEEELIEQFLRKSVSDLAKVSSDFEIVLAIDGATDHTLDIAGRVADEFAQIRIIDLGRNLGTGKSVIPAYKAASKEIVFNQTVDSFFNSEDLPLLLSHLDHYDAVSGYRSDLSANSVYQKTLTLGNYWLIRLLFRIKLKAYQTVQFHRRAFLQSITIDASSSFISPELLFKAISAGKTVKEVQIRYYPRLAGRAKGGKPSSVLRTLRDCLKLWFVWVVLRRSPARRRPIRHVPGVTRREPS